MNTLVLTLVFSGSILMVVNIVRYFMFVRNSHDVLSSESPRDRIWKIVAGTLLCFFLMGYLFCAFEGSPDLVMASILFGGSVFVSIVLSLMFNLVETAKENSVDIAEVLVGVIDARDPNLNGHSRHVQRITMLFYKYLPAHLKRKINPLSLEFAALMHDIGKLGVPEAILNKPATLDDDEWTVMKLHPKVGVKILSPIRTFDAVKDWILYHHERIDGNGYYKLPGGQIPLAARIISIADTYSAITMHRSYKAPRVHEDAIKIITDVAGTQLDADLIRIFVTIPKEELEKCIPEQKVF